MDCRVRGTGVCWETSTLKNIYISRTFLLEAFVIFWKLFYMKTNNESHLKIKVGLYTVNLEYTCTHRNTQNHIYRIRSASPLSRSGIIISFFIYLTHLYLGHENMLLTISQSSCQRPVGLPSPVAPVWGGTHAGNWIFHTDYISRLLGAGALQTWILKL